MTSHLSNTLTKPQSITTPALPVHFKRLVLTGFMGAGKSTIGRLLAARLHWNFLDLDTHLEQRTGATIPQLFERHGEARFRRLESAALASALSQTRVVLALGGGTPEESANQALLEEAAGTFTIFLDAPFPTLFDRCALQDAGKPDARPVLANPAEALIRFEHRRPLYRSLANLTLQTDGQIPDETVHAIVSALTAPNQTPHFRP